jgi:hypothetical protein
MRYRFRWTAARNVAHLRGFLDSHEKSGGVDIDLW